MTSHSRDFPNHQQMAGSKVCGPICLQNIYERLGKKISLKEILEDLRLTDQDSTYLPQLARHLLKHKVNIKLISANSYVFAPEWKTAKKEHIIAELKEWIVRNVYIDFYRDWIQSALHNLYYLEDGGELEIKNITKEDLDQALYEKKIVLATFEETHLWQRRKIKDIQKYDAVRGNANGHFVVIFDQDDDHYLVSDPYPTKLKDREGIYKVAKNDVISGIYLRGANYLIIEP